MAMRVLDVFSGTQSISKVFRKEGHECITVDVDPVFKPTHLVDVLQWDYKSIYQPNDFDYVHCSPPCIMYSSLNVCNYGRYISYKGEDVLWCRDLHEKALEESDLLVKKALEMIDYFKPRFWTIENPYHNLFPFLGKRECMRDKPFVVAGYCEYGMDYKKPTAFFNNFDLVLSKCSHKGRENHKKVISTQSNNGNIVGGLYKKYVIPQLLVKSIHDQIIEKQVLCV